MLINCTHVSSCFGSSYHTNFSSSHPLKNAQQHWYSSSMILGSSPRATPSLAQYNRNSQPVNAWPSAVAHFLSTSNSSRAQSNAEVCPIARAYDDLRARTIHNLRSTSVCVCGRVIASSSKGVSWDGKIQSESGSRRRRLPCAAEIQCMMTVDCPRVFSSPEYQDRCWWLSSVAPGS